MLLNSNTAGTASGVDYVPGHLLELYFYQKVIFQLLLKNKMIKRTSAKIFYTQLQTKSITGFGHCVLKYDIDVGDSPPILDNHGEGQPWWHKRQQMLFWTK